MLFTRLAAYEGCISPHTRKLERIRKCAWTRNIISVNFNTIIMLTSQILALVYNGMCKCTVCCLQGMVLYNTNVFVVTLDVTAWQREVSGQEPFFLQAMADRSVVTLLILSTLDEFYPSQSSTIWLPFSKTLLDFLSLKPASIQRDIKKTEGRARAVRIAKLSRLLLLPTVTSILSKLAGAKAWTLIVL